MLLFNGNFTASAIVFIWLLLGPKLKGTEKRQFYTVISKHRPKVLWVF